MTTSGTPEMVAPPDYRRVFEALPGACLVLDRALVVVAVTDSFLPIVRRSREQVIGGGLFDLGPDRPEVRASIERAIERRTADTVVIGSQDGRCWSRTTSPVIDADGEIRYLIHRAEDVTASVRQEDQLRQLVDNMEIAAIRVDRDSLIQRANQAAARLLGFDHPDELIGVELGALLVDQGVRPDFRDELERRGVVGGQLAMRRRDGTTVTVQGGLRAVRDASGQLIGGDAVIRDVTDELRLHDEIVRAREAAVAASRAKTAFLANVSHEIRTPMNAILGLAHLALGARPPPRIRDYLIQLQTAARSLLDLLNDVLDVSKIEAGRLTLEATPFELDRVLDSAAHVISLRAAEKELEIAFSIGAEVPPRLVGDPMRLGQVLINFMSNAVKFTESGSVVVAVSAPERPAEDRCLLRFEVRDTGIGMDDLQLARLFQPFSQADASTTRRFGGTGLGLAICKQLVERMGGAIEVASAPGRGTSFAFAIELPVAPPDPERPEGWLEPDLHGARVLVVDDSQVALDLLAGSLEGLGLAPTCVGSGAEALAAIAGADRCGQPFRIALIDARMPPPDGFETAERIAADPSLTAPPVTILMSAYTRDELGDGREALPAVAFLRKPISRSALHDALVAALRQAATRPGNGGPPMVERTLDRVRLLVVEDNEINQLIAREILERAGALVTVASSGPEAIDLATEAQPPFDAILMDVQMPEMDGHATTRALRRSPRTRAVPILAMTAQAFEEERRACIASGMNDHIAKPVDPDLLIETVARWVPRERAPVDPELLTRIFGDDPARQVAFLRRLVSTLERSMDEVADAAGRRAADELAALGHKLKSPARSVGATALADALEALEEAARSRTWHTVDLLRERALRALGELGLYVDRAAAAAD